jgi:hypothetical protein
MCFFWAAACVVASVKFSVHPGLAACERGIPEKDNNSARKRERVFMRYNLLENRLMPTARCALLDVQKFDGFYKKVRTIRFGLAEARWASMFQGSFSTP